MQLFLISSRLVFIILILEAIPLKRSNVFFWERWLLAVLLFMSRLFSFYFSLSWCSSVNVEIRWVTIPFIDSFWNNLEKFDVFLKCFYILNCSANFCFLICCFIFKQLVNDFPVIRLMIELFSCLWTLFGNGKDFINIYGFPFLNFSSPFYSIGDE